MKNFLLLFCTITLCAMTMVGCSEDDELATKTYTVAFDSQGGSKVSNQTVNEGEKVTAPAAPTKEGFVFDAWYTSADYATRWDFDKDVVTKDLTLYARWTANSFTVTFNTNGGTAIDAVEIAEGGVLAEVPTPEKEGFTFAGWYTDEALTQEFNAESPVTANFTLYAKWEEIKEKEDVTLQQLIDLLDEVRYLKINAYTDESVGKLEEKREVANQVLYQGENAPQAEINAAYYGLKEAIEALVPSPVTGIELSDIYPDANGVREFTSAAYSESHPFTFGAQAVVANGYVAVNSKIRFEYTPAWEQWAASAPEVGDCSFSFVPKADLADGTEIVVTMKADANPEVTKTITLKAVAGDFKALYIEAMSSMPETSQLTVDNYKELYDKFQLAMEYGGKLTPEENEEADVTAFDILYYKYYGIFEMGVGDITRIDYEYEADDKDYKMIPLSGSSGTYRTYEADGSFPVGMYCEYWRRNYDDAHKEYPYSQWCLVLKGDGTYLDGTRYSNNSSGSNPTEVFAIKEWAQGVYHVFGDTNSGMIVMQYRK